MHWKKGHCKIHNAQPDQRMGITSNSCSSHRMLLDSTTHFRLRTNSSLSKNCIHEVYMEIISDCVVDEPLWPLLRFPLVSEHHIIVPSSTHAYSHPKPSLERISRIEEQRIRVNHLLAIESRLHLRLFFLLTVNPSTAKSLVSASPAPSPSSLAPVPSSARRCRPPYAKTTKEIERVRVGR